MLALKMRLTCAILLFLLPVIAFAQSGTPVIKAGTATISGHVNIPKTISKDSVWLYFRISQPFTGPTRLYKTLLAPDGRFVLKVNTETNISLCTVSTDIDVSKSVLMMVKSGQENKISFNYMYDGTLNNLKTSDNFGFTEEDLIHGLSKLDDLHTPSKIPKEHLYNKEFGYFIDYINSIIQSKKSLMNQPPLLSEKMKEIIFKDYTLGVYLGWVFKYLEYMDHNYRAMNDNKAPDSSVIKMPMRKDYSFLKNMDLNNPMNLYYFSYSDFTQEVLKDNALNIPRIQDMPIPDWTKKVKDILGSLMGFDRGLFYDMLISNAYALQLEVELKPLTTKQMENIKNYYKGGELEKILLRRNQEIIPSALLKEKLVVNPTPDVSPKELMNTIISRYKGKTVIVDFWATWCGPCLQAINGSRDLKKQFINKDAVFIYISNPSSPRKLWEMQIQGIGGEQYYLSKKEWEYILNSYHFEGIPSYLIFDKNGVLKHQFTGYPGNEVMQKRIEAAMQGDLAVGNKQ